MKVFRLSKEALDKIMNGHVKEPATFVIKFYKPSCHMCNSLSDHYKELAAKDKYQDKIHFFAVNIEDYLSAESDLGFEGVPTIVAVRAKGLTPGQYRTEVQIMPDPPDNETNPQMWYHPHDMEKFFDKLAR